MTIGSDFWTTIIDDDESLTRVELGGQLLYSVHATRKQDHVLVHEEIGAAFGAGTNSGKWRTAAAALLRLHPI